MIWKMDGFTGLTGLDLQRLRQVFKFKEVLVLQNLQFHLLGELFLFILRVQKKQKAGHFLNYLVMMVIVNPQLHTIPVLMTMDGQRLYYYQNGLEMDIFIIQVERV